MGTADVPDGPVRLAVGEPWQCNRLVLRRHNRIAGSLGEQERRTHAAKVPAYVPSVPPRSLVMRRLLLAAALVVGCAFGLVPAQANPYVGETSLANASMIIRGTDGNMWQLEVIVAQHDLAGAKKDVELSLRIGGPCHEGGCPGSTFSVPVNGAVVKFTPKSASVSFKYGGAPIQVSWTARKGYDQGDPEPELEEGNGGAQATIFRQDRSAPAVMTVAGLRCSTRTAHLFNQTGARVSTSAASEGPSKLPAGFFRKGARKPRCV